MALALVMVVIAGIVIGVSIRQRQHQATDRQAASAALINQIDQRQEQVTARRAQATDLRGEVASLRETALNTSQEGQQLLDALTEHEAQAGLLPVTGPGIEITVADPPPQEGNDPVGQPQPTAQEGLVTDTDLQSAVNALWAAGAEAIAINGSRIGPTTAIRQAGGAILIDFQPTSSPYLFEVVGDPATLPAKFAATEPARRLNTYRTAYGAQYAVHTAQELWLPAASEPTTTGAAVAGGN